MLGETGSGQGGGRARDPRALAPRGRAVPARELRRDPARPDRLGAVRPRARQLHRRGRRAEGLVRARRRRDAVPRRDRRAAARRAGAPAARAAGRHARARRRPAPDHVDVRIVAATHRDLRAMVAERTLPRGLWYRIAVFPIELPPLRERLEDIPALAKHFALRAATRFGTPPRIPTPRGPRAARRLPVARQRARADRGDRARGDPRQRRAARGGEGARRRAAARPRASRRAAPRARSAERRASRSRRSTHAMARHIEAALERTRGRIEGPRRRRALLGINPHTLRARMRKLGVDWRRFRDA